MLYSSSKALARMKTGKSQAQLDKEMEFEDFVLQAESVGFVREDYELKFCGTSDDPIASSLDLRLKTGSITNVVADSSMFGTA